MRTLTLGCFGAVFGSLVLASSVAQAANATWQIAAPSRTQITGGPWVIAQGFNAFPTPNPSTNNFQPYYQSFSAGTDTTLQGYFDYRIKDVREAVVAASSTDSGKTWTFQSEVLQFDSPSLANDAAAASDTGEGHPFVMSVGNKTFLYTLDRDTTAVDNLGLIVRELTPTSNDPLNGAPKTAQPGNMAVKRTVGMTTPDGILSVIPGSNPLAVLYLAKDITKTPNVVTVHYAQTTDGTNFTNDTLVTGLVDLNARPFIGPRGTVVKYTDGTFGLFFSAGLVGEDADAFHFVGYAESADAKSWTVVNDVANPLLSIDATKDPNGLTAWYAGRVYAPNVTLSADGCTGTITFSGYAQKKATGDYRQIGRATLTKKGCGPLVDAGPNTDASVPDASAANDSGAPKGDGGSTPLGPTGNDAGCSCTVEDSSVGSAAGVVATMLGLSAWFARRRRRKTA